MRLSVSTLHLIGRLSVSTLHLIVRLSVSILHLIVRLGLVRGLDHDSHGLLLYEGPETPPLFWKELSHGRYSKPGSHDCDHCSAQPNELTGYPSEKKCYCCLSSILENDQNLSLS